MTKYAIVFFRQSFSIPELKSDDLHIFVNEINKQATVDKINKN